MPKKISVCYGKNCCSRGSEHILNELKKNYHEQGAQLQSSECTGYCEEGPIVIIDDEYIIKDSAVSTIVENIKQENYQKINRTSFEDITKNDILGDLL
jgi:NADH:ubiquinone oxidoreductase subunit E